MKTIFLLFLIAFVMSNKSASAQHSTDEINGIVEISLFFEKKEGRGSNQYAVWVEDDKGNLVKTLFVTRFTAQGGWEKRPACTPMWVQRSTAQPIPKEEIDGFTGATPSTGMQTYTWNGTDREGKKVPKGIYKVMVEGTLYNDSYVIYQDEINTAGAGYNQTIQPEFRNETDNHKNMIKNVSVQFKP